MGTTDNLFGMDPNTASNLLNFGFSTMAASQQPGISTLAALGKGGEGMNAAAQQRAQTQNISQEGIGKTLQNAMQLRSLNLGNAAMGLQPINMQGVPDLLGQLNQQSQSPSNATAGTPWSTSPGGSMPTATRTAPSGQSSGNGYSGILGKLNVSQDVMDVAMQKRMPRTADEAIQAAKVDTYLQNPYATNLTNLAMKGAEPYDLRPGGSHINPLGETTVNPSHVQNVSGIMQPFAPAPVTYGNQGANGGNASGGGINQNGIKTGYSIREKSAQDNYFGKETDSYNSAQKNMQNLELMQHSIDTMNQPGSALSTGTWAERKLGFAKALQSAGFNTIDPNEIAAGESLLKTTGRLGFTMSKELGAREPGIITQQAIKLNPGIENSPAGLQLLKNSVQEETQRIIDEHNFKGQFYGQNGYNQPAAESAFDSKYPPQSYAQRATSQLDPIKVNKPGAINSLLVGTKVMTPRGVKIVGAKDGGIAPPAYTAISQPQVPQQVPEQDSE